LITYRQYGSGEIAVRLPGGGKAFFNFAYGANSATAYESNSRLDITRDQSGVITAFTLTYPGGVRYVYEFFRTDNLGAWDQVYLTQRISRHGYAITLAYATYNPGTRVVRLASVTDPDGRSITLQYAAGIPAHPNLVSSATSSHYSLTASLVYNAAGQLTSITDVVGIQSTLTYAASCPATLTTPYGTTSFAPAEVQYMADDSVIARSMVVTEPNQGRQIFAMLYQCLWMPYNPPAAVIPAGPSGNTFDSAYTHLLFNSFHWDQQQAQGLPAAVVNFATSAFVKARMFHWLERQSSPAHPSSTAAYRRDPSPDGTAEGQYTWFDHTGKSQPWFAGTQILPKTVARVMPDGQTAFEQFQRNAFGLPTQIIERWGPNASPLYRTNSFVYAANAIDLIEHRGPTACARPLRLQRLPPTDQHHQRPRRGHHPDLRRPAPLADRPDPGRIAQHPHLWHQTASSNPNYRRVQTITDSPVARSRSVTWLGAYVRTLTDERGFTRTFTRDKVGRLTQIDYPLQHPRPTDHPHRRQRRHHHPDLRPAGAPAHPRLPRPGHRTVRLLRPRPDLATPVPTPRPRPTFTTRRPGKPANSPPNPKPSVTPTTRPATC
jgi:hypothetical protein